MLRSFRRPATMAVLIGSAAMMLAACGTSPAPSPTPTRAPATSSPTTEPTASPTTPPTTAPTSTPPAPTPSASPAPSATPSASPSTSPIPGVVFKPGQVDLTGTRWVLVGYAGGAGIYVSPSADAIAELRISDEGELAGSTGAADVGGGYQRNGRLITITLTSGAEPGTGELAAQHDAIVAALKGAAAHDVLLDPKNNMAPGATDADFDARLLAHFEEHADVMHLILRDASGEAVLVYGAAE